MDNIIKELIMIEKQAKDVTGDIEQDKKNLSLNIKKRTEEIEKEIEATTKKRIHEIKEIAFNAASEKISTIITETQEKFSNLEMEFEGNKEKWQQEIFDSIIGR